MHDFAIVALLALAAYKLVDFLTGLIKNEDRTVRLFVTMAVGVIATELLDYSVFAGWGTAIRESWMGPVFTGLIVGATAYVWHEILAYLGGLGRRSDESERRTPRAA